ncbi:hypothetical protein U1Q18_015534 [Sarracenia purpurea var. burkii]
MGSYAAIIDLVIVCMAHWCRKGFYSSAPEISERSSRALQGVLPSQALEGSGTVQEPNFRVGGSNDDMRFIDERLSRDSIYLLQECLHRDMLERETYPPPPPTVGLWPQTRRRSYEEEYSLDRDSRRQEKPYANSYHEMDAYCEADKYHAVDTF